VTCVAGAKYPLPSWYPDRMHTCHTDSRREACWRYVCRILVCYLLTCSSQLIDARAYALQIVIFALRPLMFSVSICHYAGHTLVLHHAGAALSSSNSLRS
jgi:hypothetical protein